MVTSDHPSARLLAATLAQLGLRDAVISPGSRNAPLVIAFWHHPDIRVIVAGDERSAAHVALGLACQTRRPAAVISTSGTAAINHGPAIAEAHFAGTPLISITADRPAAVRHAGHGQTAYQPGLFANHVAFEAELDEHALTEDALCDLIAAGWQASLRGPVHFNVPFAEPLYGTQPPTPNSQLQTKNSQLQTPNSQPPTPNSQLQTPNSQLPTKNSQLPNHPTRPARQPPGGGTRAPNPQPPTPN